MKRIFISGLVALILMPLLVFAQEDRLNSQRIDEQGKS